MKIGSVTVFLLLLGISLFQPVVARYEARRYYRKALKILAPCVWFATDNIYHETLDYTSLKEPESVTDLTKSRKTILFTLTISTDISSSSVSFPLPVPSGFEETGTLVRRYRQERLSS